MLVCPFLEKLTFNNSYISILSFIMTFFVKKNIHRAQGYDPTNFSFLMDDGLFVGFLDSWLAATSTSEQIDDQD